MENEYSQAEGQTASRIHHVKSWTREMSQEMGQHLNIAFPCWEMTSWPLVSGAQLLSGERNSRYFCFQSPLRPPTPLGWKTFIFQYLCQRSPSLVTVASFSPNTAEVKAAAHPSTDFLPRLTKFCINNAGVFLELPTDQLTAQFGVFF